MKKNDLMESSKKLNLAVDALKELGAYRNSAKYKLSETALARQPSMGGKWRRFSLTNQYMEIYPESGLQLDSNFIDNFTIRKKSLMSLLMSVVARAVTWASKKAILKNFAYQRAFERLWGSGKGIVELSDLTDAFGVPHYERLLAAHYFNRINEFGNRYRADAQRFSILEVGPGVGNLGLMFNKFEEQDFLYVCIDLPEAIPFAYANLKFWDDTVSIILPHQINSDMDFDSVSKQSKRCFIFLTPDQCDVLPSDYFDLVVNTNSFSEMCPSEIDKYFKVFRRTVAMSGFFFCCNRVEKSIRYSDRRSVRSHARYGDNEVIRNVYFDFPWVESDIFLRFETDVFNGEKTRYNFLLSVVRLNKNYE